MLRFCCEKAFDDRVMKDNIMKKKVIKAAAPAVFWFLVWMIAWKAVNQDLLLASPLQVLKCFPMLGTGSFWLKVCRSLNRGLEAYAAGVSAGFLLAVLCSVFPWADLLIRPALTVIRATPVASFIILALVWLSADRVPVLAGALMTMPVIFMSVYTGVTGADPQLVEMARLYGFSKPKIWRRVILPGLFPSFVASAETCVGICFKATIAAEVIGLPRDSIGSGLHNAKIYLETDQLMFWTLIVILLSLTVEKSIRFLLERGLKRVHHSS